MCDRGEGLPPSRRAVWSPLRSRAPPLDQLPWSTSSCSQHPTSHIVSVMYRRSPSPRRHGASTHYAAAVHAVSSSSLAPRCPSNPTRHISHRESTAAWRSATALSVSKRAGRTLFACRSLPSDPQGDQPPNPGSGSFQPIYAAPSGRLQQCTCVARATNCGRPAF